MKISFKEWALANYDFFFLEAPLDLSRFPTDKIEFDKDDNDDDEGFVPDEFEEEDFDEDYARNRCEDAHSINDYDLNDYSYGEIFDSIEDDPNFKAESPEEWEENNPEPKPEDFDSEEEYKSATETWQSERDDIESDYESAVEDWEEENDRTRENAEESAEEARQRDIEECVNDSRENWDEEQDNRREEHRDKVEQDREDFLSKLPPYKSYNHKFGLNGKKYKVEIDRNTDYYQDQKLVGVFDVFFEKENDKDSGYSLERNSSPQHAREVYSILIATLIKFVQEEESTGHPVNGFHFSASEPEMEIVYDLFYKNYLIPSGFIRVKIEGNDFYLKKDYIREKSKNLKTPEKMNLLRGIVDSNRSKKQLIQNVRNFKLLSRENALFFPQIKNKILYFKDFNEQILLCYVEDLSYGNENMVKNSNASSITINKIKVLYERDGQIHPALLMKSDFVQKQVDKNDFVNFFQALIKSQYFHQVQGADFKKYYNLFNLGSSLSVSQ
jgi:hypothetical protein